MDGSGIDQTDPRWSAVTAARVAAWRGAIETPFLPLFILFATFLGFGALASEIGLTPFHALFASIFIFALPAQIVLADQMAHGASIVTAALAVAATGVRLLPMTVSLIPAVRHPGVPKWVEYLIAHFVAVTMWVETMRRAPGVPRHLRAAYVLGLSVNLVLASCLGALMGFILAAKTPPVITAALLFLSPVYFMLAMLSGARDAEGLAPIFIGLVLGPLFHIVVPEFDLLLTGLIGGTISYWMTRRFFAPKPMIVKGEAPSPDGEQGPS